MVYIGDPRAPNRSISNFPTHRCFDPHPVSALAYGAPPMALRPKHPK